MAYHLTRQIHIGHRLGQENFLAADGYSGVFSQFLPGLEIRAVLLGESVHHHKPGIVPRLLILCARISQSGNKNALQSISCRVISCPRGRRSWSDCRLRLFCLWWKSFPVRRALRRQEPGFLLPSGWSGARRGPADRSAVPRLRAA